jgi:hypothetical protein
MYDMDTLFSSFNGAEMIPVMKRAFNDASRTIHGWGTCETIFDDDEMSAIIACEIMGLVQQGVTDARILSDRALSRFGVAALDRVASNLMTITDAEGRRA